LLERDGNEVREHEYQAQHGSAGAYVTSDARLPREVSTFTRYAVGGQGQESASTFIALLDGVRSWELFACIGNAG
jgi:hypothetical protein